MIRTNKFSFVLLVITLYESLTSLLRPDNSSYIKVAVTMLLWIAVFISVAYFFAKLRIVKKKIPSYAFRALILLILLNGINVVRSLFDGDLPLATSFGNPYNSLGLLTPFALAFVANKANVNIINRVFLILVTLGLFLKAAFFLGFYDDLHYRGFGVNLIFPVVFLIGTIHFQSRINKLIIYSASLMLFFYSGVIAGVRTMLLRIPLLYFSSVAVYIYSKYKARWIPGVAIFSLVLPFCVFVLDFNSDITIFQKATTELQKKFGSDSSENALAKHDTRTFLYIEVLEDLANSNGMLFGKGGSGTYFSSYFQQTGEDNDRRLTVEVGVLSLLLKGGVVAVVLNLFLLFVAIFLAFFRSKNKYILWVGFMLMVHTLILFLENVNSYSLYNFSIWFFVGVCLSKELREMDNREMVFVLK